MSIRHQQEATAPKKLTFYSDVYRLFRIRPIIHFQLLLGEGIISGGSKIVSRSRHDGFGRWLRRFCGLDCSCDWFARWASDILICKVHEASLRYHVDSRQTNHRLKNPELKTTSRDSSMVEYEAGRLIPKVPAFSMLLLSSPRLILMGCTAWLTDPRRPILDRAEESRLPAQLNIRTYICLCSPPWSSAIWASRSEVSPLTGLR